MATQDMITAQDFCIHHNVEISFIQSLNESGLIEVTQQEETLCVPLHQLPQLEKMVRLYYEMDINMEGLETITHLLNRMNEMQQEIVKLQNRLGVYEEE
ncbi:MAG: chaperone modulator CbpM [Chitinophagaceae bacterium]|nr:chaperone modulator CbpM [Chitinophagaceae bacterium]MBK8606446.1 chaperone modulator CbpM [Chitinophagaceae bacterium]MBP6476316.1 chaperone modulator CbpM [Chitinophagaceae bacterium]MBP7108113.1 chaperone modulator CbpM [Chitinophagaceae bacterium]MBP7313687.1 chaperone modulator CbpM [Chitinophagaceae bacterium]